MDRLINLIRTRSSEEKRCLALLAEQQNAMASLMECEEKEKPTAKYIDELNRVEREIRNDGEKIERLKSRIFDAAAGIIEKQLRELPALIATRQKLKNEFEEKAGQSLAAAVFYLNELKLPEPAAAIKKIFKDALSQPSPGLEAIEQHFNRGFSENPGLQDLSEQVQRLTILKKNPANLNYHVKKLIVKVENDLI